MFSAAAGCFSGRFRQHLREPEIACRAAPSGVAARHPERLTRGGDWCGLPPKGRIGVAATHTRLRDAWMSAPRGNMHLGPAYEYAAGSMFVTNHNASPSSQIFGCGVSSPLRRLILPARETLPPEQTLGDHEMGHRHPSRAPTLKRRRPHARTLLFLVATKGLDETRLIVAG